MGLEYSITNENLHAITLGMDLQKEDITLGILNDSCFAMLEFCQKVYAVDINPVQVKHGKKKIDNLRNKNYDQFFINVGKGHCDISTDLIERGYSFEKQKSYLKNYFTKKRLENIRFKLDNLIILNEDIFSVLDSGIYFNKIYLSSLCIFYHPEKAEELLDPLLKNDLIYTSSESPIKIPGCFNIDKEKTKIAKSLEGEWWDPAVLIKK